MTKVNTSYISYPANRSNRKRTETRHLVLHETVSKADARRQLNYFNTGDRGANCHVFIDWNEVLGTLPLDEVGWHVGPKANAFTEGVELCRASNEADFKKQWQLAVEWFAYRCEVYGRGADMILSHHEVAKMYGGTDHTDPDEYFAMYGKTVDDFRAAVTAVLSRQKEPVAPKFAADVAELATRPLSAMFEAAPESVRTALNFAANEARRAAGQQVKVDRGKPDRAAADKVAATLSALWHTTDRDDVRGVYSLMADALRAVEA